MKMTKERAAIVNEMRILRKGLQKGILQPREELVHHLVVDLCKAWTDGIIDTEYYMEMCTILVDLGI